MGRESAAASPPCSPSSRQGRQSWARWPHWLAHEAPLLPPADPNGPRLPWGQGQGLGRPLHRGLAAVGLCYARPLDTRRSPSRPCRRSAPMGPFGAGPQNAQPDPAQAQPFRAPPPAGHAPGPPPPSATEEHCHESTDQDSNHFIVNKASRQAGRRSPLPSRPRGVRKQSNPKSPHPTPPAVPPGSLPSQPQLSREGQHSRRGSPPGEWQRCPLQGGTRGPREERRAQLQLLGRRYTPPE